LDARLSILNARRIAPGVWLIHSDYCIEAMDTALRTLLDDRDQFFAAAIDENCVSHNLGQFKL
jgi:hypothetical protein